MTNEQKHDVFSERYGDSSSTIFAYITYFENIYDKRCRDEGNNN